MALTRIIAKDDGSSHFVDEEVAVGNDFVRLSGPHECVSWEIGQGPSGHKSDFRTTEVPKALIVMEGLMTVEVSTGERRIFGPGSALLATDTYGKGHKVELHGDTVCRVLTISMPPIS